MLLALAGYFPAMHRTQAIAIVDRAVSELRWNLMTVADFIGVTPEAMRRWRDGRTTNLSVAVARNVEALDKKIDQTLARRARKARKKASAS